MATQLTLLLTVLLLMVVLLVLQQQQMIPTRSTSQQLNCCQSRWPTVYLIHLQVCCVRTVFAVVTTRS
jgi:hypothetical protein